MRKLPIIFTLMLTVAWAYTSWYWYTCNIKWFCPQEQKQNQINSITQEDVFLEEETQNPLWVSLSWTVESTSNSSKLSAEDVLSENKKVEKTELVILQDEKDDIDINISVGSGSLETEQNDEKIEAKITETSPEQHSLCTSPIIGPIWLGRDNNVAEVKNLEAFLVSQGEKLVIDGEYGQDEFEAIKRFQLKYRSDILDPWDIAEPTGYVYTTTIKKIQNLACK